MKATPISSSISANLGNSGEAMVEIHKYSVKFMAATLSYFFRASRGGGEQTNYIFHMDYNVKATPISSSISANLGNFREAMVEIHKYSVKFMAATLSYFL